MANYLWCVGSTSRTSPTLQGNKNSHFENQANHEPIIYHSHIMHFLQSNPQHWKNTACPSVITFSFCHKPRMFMHRIPVPCQILLKIAKKVRETSYIGEVALRFPLKEVMYVDGIGSTSSLWADFPPSFFKKIAIISPLSLNSCSGRYGYVLPSNSLYLTKIVGN